MWNAALLHYQGLLLFYLLLASVSSIPSLILGSPCAAKPAMTPSDGDMATWRYVFYLDFPFSYLNNPLQQHSRQNQHQIMIENAGWQLKYIIIFILMTIYYLYFTSKYR
ncbi:hypothetical protein [Undibacterium sp. Ji50W]|uniref:hypothetical protein n=1 Tax=Undibacterium sp. Ji50W TaxID=3413041 RepID=UPI003BF53B99